jgi:hypothetical protein
MAAQRGTVDRVLRSALPLSLVMSPVLSAQDAPAAFAALSGDWVGEGSMFSRPARFTMRWRAQGGFAVLEFTNGFVDSLGEVTPALRSAAVYRTDPARPEGVWLDSRGVRIELMWEASDSTLVVNWAAPTESGRTTYRADATGEVHVVDEVRSGGTWRTFAMAAYRRRAP